MSKHQDIVLFPMTGNIHTTSPMRKKLATMTAHRELTVTKMVTASRDWAVTWAVIELWPSRDWAVIILKMPWLSCDLAVTELWPRRDWAVTSPSRDWAVIIGPGAVTTVVTVSSQWDHRELTVCSQWQFFSHGHLCIWVIFEEISIYICILHQSYTPNWHLTSFIMAWSHHMVKHHQTCIISHTKSQNLNVCHLILQLVVLPNLLKPGIKSRM